MIFLILDSIGVVSKKAVKPDAEIAIRSTAIDAIVHHNKIIPSILSLQNCLYITILLLLIIFVNILLIFDIFCDMLTRSKEMI